MKRGVSQETIDPLYLVFHLSGARHVTNDNAQSERNLTSQSRSGINERIMVILLKRR